MPTAVLSVVIVPNGGVSQTLPGPASGGWYVLMGPNPYGGKTYDIGAGPFYAHLCTAWVVPSSGNERPGNLAIPISKRFGPYATRKAAYDALKAAGWECSEGNALVAAGTALCAADTGCQR